MTFPFYLDLYRVTLCMCSAAFCCRQRSRGFATKTKALARELPPATQATVGEAKMSRQTTLGRFGFEKSLSRRDSVVETKVADFVSPMSRTIECNHLKL